MADKSFSVGDSATLVKLVDLRDGTYAQAAGTISGVFDSTGAWFPLESCSLAYAYNGDGTINTITAASGATVWVKTYTYTGTKLTGESAWVKQ